MPSGSEFDARASRRSRLPFFSGVVLGVVLLLSSTALTSVLAASPQVIVGGGGTCSGNLQNIHVSSSSSNVSVHSTASCNVPVGQIKDTTTLYVKQWYGLEYLGSNSETYNNSKYMEVVVQVGCPSSNGETYYATEYASFTDSGQTQTASYSTQAYLVC